MVACSVLKRFVAVLLLLLFPYFMYAQDPFLTQAYSNPLQLNPSFAGSMGCSRAVVSYNNQWPLNTANYVTEAFSYDKHVKFLHGGFGLNYMHDNEAGGVYISDRLGIIYSPTFIVNKKVSIKPSIETAYFTKSVNWSSLTFDDMIDPLSGFVYNTLETQKLSSVSGFDFSTGILVNTNKWNCGMAIYHLSQPDQALLGIEPMPRKYSFNASYTFSKNDSANFAFSPALFFVRQGVHQLLMMTFNFKYKWARFGTGFRNNSAVFMLGANVNRFTLNYSYDLNASNFSNTLGTHQITFSCLFRYKRKAQQDGKKVVQPIDYNVIPLKTVAF